MADVAGHPLDIQSQRNSAYVYASKRKRGNGATDEGVESEQSSETTPLGNPHSRMGRYNGLQRIMLFTQFVFQYHIIGRPTQVCEYCPHVEVRINPKYRV